MFALVNCVLVRVAIEGAIQRFLARGGISAFTFDGLSGSGPQVRMTFDPWHLLRPRVTAIATAHVTF